MSKQDSQNPNEMAADVVRRMADDLAWLANRTLHVDRVQSDLRAEARAVGDSVNIAFRFAVERNGTMYEGALCMPLSEATTFAAGLLGYDAKATLEAGALDAPTLELKSAMVELSKFVGKAAKVQLARALSEQTHGEGRSCVGLRPGSAPRIAAAGELMTLSAEWSFHGRDPFEITLAMDSAVFAAEVNSEVQRQQAAA